MVFKNDNIIYRGGDDKGKNTLRGGDDKGKNALRGGDDKGKNALRGGDDKGKNAFESNINNTFYQPAGDKDSDMDTVEQEIFSAKTPL